MYRDRQSQYESQKRYREVNRDKIVADKKRYYEENKEKIKKKSAAWRVQNQDRYKQQNAKDYKKNRDKILATGKKWRQENAAKVVAYNAEYRKKNKAKLAGMVAANRALRRARKKAATVGDKKPIVAVYTLAVKGKRVRCYLCGKIIPKGKREVDHVVPLSRGGLHAVHNLEIACAKCNGSKRVKLPNEIGLLF